MDPSVSFNRYIVNKEAKVSQMVDWWMFGILAYELMVGSTPFPKSKKTNSLYRNIKEGKLNFEVFQKSEKIESHNTMPFLSCEKAKNLIQKVLFFFFSFSLSFCIP